VVKIEEGGEDKEGEGVAVAEEEEAGREEEKPLGKETARIGMKVEVEAVFASTAALTAGLCRSVVAAIRPRLRTPTAPT